MYPLVYFFLFWNFIYKAIQFKINVTWQRSVALLFDLKKNYIFASRSFLKRKKNPCIPCVHMCTHYSLLSQKNFLMKCINKQEINIRSLLHNPFMNLFLILNMGVRSLRWQKPITTPGLEHPVLISLDVIWKYPGRVVEHSRVVELSIL